MRFSWLPASCSLCCSLYLAGANSPIISGTVGYMAQTGAPAPPVAALVAIAVELFVSIAVVLGVWTRPLALLLALYTLATAFFGHHYWTMTGADQYENMTNFYKNISIIG